MIDCFSKLATMQVMRTLSVYEISYTSYTLRLLSECPQRAEPL